MRLPAPILSVLDAFRAEFRRPTWPRALTLVAGTLLARGRRTVAAALRAAGHGDDSAFRRYHEVLSRAAWSPLRLARRLLGLLIAAFAPAGGLTLVVDETIERRWGRKITKRSHHRDPVASSRGQHVVASGLRWGVDALVVAVPWARRPWALPFLSQLAPSAKTDERQRRRHKTLAHRARQVAAVARRWLPGVPLTLVGDTTYSVIAPGRACARRRVRLIAPLWWKACLHAPPPPRVPGRPGRPAKLGPALPKLKAVLADPATAWHSAEVAWPDGTTRRLELASGTAPWNESGAPALPIRWVLVRDPAGRLESRAYFTTEPDDEPAWVVAEFARRRTIEVTFQEGRAHLGVETQRQWSDRAIERQTPCLLGLYAVVALLTRAVATGRSVPVRASAWYRKTEATFADGLASVRRVLWDARDCCETGDDPRFATILRSDLVRLRDAACYVH